MKERVIAFAVLMLGMATKSFAQYHPFPDSGAVWVEEHVQPGSYPCLTTNTFEIYNAGDTLIGGVAYLHLRMNAMYQILQYPGCNLPPWSSASGFWFDTYGFIRNDTASKKVFIIPYYYTGNDSSEFLLYDFSRQTGDTVPYSLNNFYDSVYVIDSVSTILIGGNYRNVQYVHFPCCVGMPQGVSRFIEGIGSDQGIIPDPNDWEGGDFLRCFSMYAQPLYPDTTTSCIHITGLSSIILPGIKIFPNPARDKLFFSGLDLDNVVSIQLTNISGSKVDNYFANSTCMDVSGIENGIYFLEVIIPGNIKWRTQIIVAR